MKFYILIDNKQEGPYSLYKLSLKNIKPDTLVRYEEQEEWVKANTVNGLKQLFPNTNDPEVNNNRNKHIGCKPFLVSLVIGTVISCIFSFFIGSSTLNSAEALGPLKIIFIAFEFFLIAIFYALLILIIPLIIYTLTYVFTKDKAKAVSNFKNTYEVILLLIVLLAVCLIAFNLV